ncbi:TetR/AcrR family transcriptional regulator [Pseudomonas gingeri]|uniref:TetR/AcrR family transcriptional regulator n=1 Tax=Pseudomonas gingeri TaxID=117681 RepID=A0A7Y7YD94_9PSED|nr:TetR/AcrR family transcriptional regulator [Pseudomonas gingeri]NWA02399.1 TetR/AcrR family transcriptional regulator [Pseudomonas gingeri]NWA12428.1 TetR/AcrR family transcriptional regulator [Pseudomonas gingeri]NWA57166.1 TetR/AcrR family transcriptional regulator [Pseudomonas gingeri]NWA93509.1 TetR/AcrR family transcriptional regulator [Pseudomonas gingeri]NWB02981.1 TetR/AcrR family transcriptional regulator [Pseudomonas gingeri]
MARAVLAMPAMPGEEIRARPSRHLETRAKAVALFARRGFAQVGLRELAGHLGIQAGSIYNHIESKEALLFELIESLYLDLLGIVTPPLRTSRSAEKRLNELIAAHLDLHRDKGDFFRVAEHEFHCLEATHQATVLVLRRRYESHLVKLLTPLGLSSDETLALTTVRTFLCLLNNLPAWTDEAGLEPGGYRALMHNIALGAVKGALTHKSPNPN